MCKRMKIIYNALCDFNTERNKEKEESLYGPGLPQ